MGRARPQVLLPSASLVFFALTTAHSPHTFAAWTGETVTFGRDPQPLLKIIPIRILLASYKMGKINFLSSFTFSFPNLVRAAALANGAFPAPEHTTHRSVLSLTRCLLLCHLETLGPRLRSLDIYSLSFCLLHAVPAKLGQAVQSERPGLCGRCPLLLTPGVLWRTQRFPSLGRGWSVVF